MLTRKFLGKLDSERCWDRLHNFSCCLNKHLEYFDKCGNRLLVDSEHKVNLASTIYLQLITLYLQIIIFYGEQNGEKNPEF